MLEITDSVAERESHRTIEILHHLRVVNDQSQLNSQQRISNISGALSASIKSTPSKHPGNTGQVIIVDDLITTGATLVEAIRALRTAGYAVIGAVTGAVANPYD